MELERISVTIDRCSKTYADGTRGLQPTSLQVEPGEVLALLGPSGCGKTTLLRLIAGLESPDQGSRILFGDQDVTQRPVEQRGVGMVFQSYALFPQMTVAANIGYGLRIRGVSPQQEQRTVGELIELTRLTGLQSKRPGELSGGQRQRVALARAVAVGPRVLLLDEPLAALDAKLKQSLREELADLLRRLNITAIHVTHDQQEAMAIADRLAVMRAGQIVQVGGGEDLYRQPSHPFVAEFLGRVNRLQRSAQAIAEQVLLLGDARIACPSGLGQAALLVRPEDIQVGAPQAGWGMARIEQRTFLGDRVQLKLRVDGQPEAILADVLRDAPFHTGDAVGIHIAPQALMPASEATP
ncbi:MAG TPA: Fe3+/spermidine/putrescine ABC transporter ATP-binding protein [Comamonadaceae bacterium]|uniref:ABC transporter ATP-binding protein n=1 Tax=Pulveribacter sp. TaxID=2678893 RepID=UPI000ECDC353|nr:ABC transporter ATP-binding protein [Pulveribacter sp.]HCL85559.1 Fe3+/spermidine/putrescine ABC transporter ATP-binding protein [Comamonadaceae bacterium]